jgi:hypothetical protein
MEDVIFLAPAGGQILPRTGISGISPRRHVAFPSKIMFTFFDVK